MNTRLADIVAAAVAEGLIPSSARESVEPGRPWPVVLLTALGAWLATLPLLGVAGILLGDLVGRGVGPYMVGVLLLAGATVILRGRGVPLFIEQLAIPFLLVGGGTLALGLFRDLPARGGALAMTGLALTVAAAIDRGWLRVVLGAIAASLAAASLALDDGHSGWPFSGPSFWLALHLTLVPWLLALGLQESRQGWQWPRLWAAFETFGAGWILWVLAGLAWWSGMTFLLAGNLGEFGNGVGRGLSGWHRSGDSLQGIFSSGLCLAGGLWLVRRWPSLGDWRNAGVTGVLAVLCWFLASLGAVLLVAALTAGTRRWRLAAAAGLAAAWIVGSFYYQLAWPLADKALLLAGLALLLGLLSWRPRPVAGSKEKTAAAGFFRPGRGRVLMAASTACTLLVANGAIWQKEILIAEGQPVFVALAPVDPRSLMQGDYMALNFGVPFSVDEGAGGFVSTGRPQLVLERDTRGVAIPKRLARPGEALRAEELLMELTPKNGRWVLVSDAWFFREGEGQRWAAARFGEFRVAPDGRALLVGMADANLKPIRP